MAEVYVGIDTSNYTTSLALANGAGEIIANLKAPRPVKEGERGLRQSDAVFAHVKNLPSLMDELKSLLRPTEGEGPIVGGIGYSAAPRRGEDSYMPCFLAGRVAATSLAAATGAPVCAFSHQEGHVMAAMYSAGVTDERIERDFVAFHVSGGTTDVLLVRADGGRFDIELLGTSLDLHAGQAIDRVGVAMGLQFPCGAAMESLAAECNVKIPKPRICVKGLDCHLSGLENLALALYQRSGDRSLAAAYTLDFIGYTLCAVAKEVQNRYPKIPMVFAGGVMSNRRIQKMIGDRFEHVWFSEGAFSADNAEKIEMASWDTTKLLVETFEEEEKEIAVVEEKTTVQDSDLKTALGERFEYLLAVLEGDKKKQREITQMPDAIVDEINEIAADILGDIIIEEDDDGGYRVIEEYREVIK